MTGTQMPLRTTAAWTTHPNANPQGRPSTPAVTRHATASAEKSPRAAPVESEERSFATSPAKKTTNASSETVAAARVRRGERIPRVYSLRLVRFTPALLPRTPGARRNGAGQRKGQAGAAAGR